MYWFLILQPLKFSNPLLFSRILIFWDSSYVPWVSMADVNSNIGFLSKDSTSKLLLFYILKTCKIWTFTLTINDESLSLVYVMRSAILFIIMISFHSVYHICPIIQVVILFQSRSSSLLVFSMVITTVILTLLAALQVNSRVSYSMIAD